MTTTEMHVESITEEAVRNGFSIIEHTETYSDGTPVYDTEEYVYLEKGNLVLTLCKTYGSILLENTKGGIQLSTTVNEFYFHEVYDNTVVVGIGNYTTLTLEA